MLKPSKELDIQHQIIHKAVKEYILRSKEDLGYLKTCQKLDIDYDSLDCSVEQFLKSVKMEKSDDWTASIEYVIEWWDLQKIK